MNLTKTTNNMKAKSKLLALSMMAAAMSTQNGNINLPNYEKKYIKHKIPLTKKQIKARAKNKAGRKQRKYNSINS